MIEAGLGGRYDATNVIPSKVQVLTGVSLEHTRWLGPTLADIATRSSPSCPTRERSWRASSTRSRSPWPSGSRRIAMPELVRPGPAGAELPLRAAGGFQRANFALAATAAEAFLGRPLDRRAVEAAAAETVVPGRLEVVAERPLTVFDGAHNPSGARALAASLESVLGERRPRVAVIGVLDDKDAAGMLRGAPARTSTASSSPVRRTRAHCRPRRSRRSTSSSVARLPRRWPTRALRSSGRVSSRARRAASSRLARSTWSRTSSESARTARVDALRQRAPSFQRDGPRIEIPGGARRGVGAAAGARAPEADA